MSTPRPHDLLWGLPLSALPDDTPQWALQVVACGQPVVVRRAACADGWVAVGVRGQSRDQRLGTQMRLGDIQRLQSPEALRGCAPSPWPAL
ncbi:phosphoribosyl-dephospho-CoA transferase, partial [Pseudomonas capeferrum]